MSASIAICSCFHRVSRLSLSLLAVCLFTTRSFFPVIVVDQVELVYANSCSTIPYRYIENRFNASHSLSRGPNISLYAPPNFADKTVHPVPSL